MLITGKLETWPLPLGNMLSGLGRHGNTAAEARSEGTGARVKVPRPVEAQLGVR